MLLLCYIMLSILEPSLYFSVLHDYVTCDYDIYDHPMTGIIHLLYFITYVTVIYDITLHSFIQV